jgi:hypothetical protein
MLLIRISTRDVIKLTLEGRVIGLIYLPKGESITRLGLDFLGDVKVERVIMEDTKNAQRRRNKGH